MAMQMHENELREKLAARLRQISVSIPPLRRLVALSHQMPTAPLPVVLGPEKFEEVVEAFFEVLHTMKNTPPGNVHMLD